VVQWIEDTAGRNLRPRDIPSPVGRTTAGWTEVRVKVPQELNSMIEQLVEHPALTGKFQTRAHVAWTLMHLGAAALYRYLKGDWREHDDVIHSASYRMSQVCAESNRIQERDQVFAVGRKTLSNIASYLRWGTAEGDFRAWKALSDAFDAQHIATNKDEYNDMMRGVGDMEMLDEGERRARLYYDKIYRGLRDDVYIELTEEYFHDLQEGVDAR
jgi:hypothetical protein